MGKFRLFDTPLRGDSDMRSDVSGYLSVYGTKATTRNEMMDNIAAQLLQKEDIASLFKVKRGGKDRDDFFWSFGKIHGLENIAFVDQAELLATKGNPVMI